MGNWHDVSCVELGESLTATLNRMVANHIWRNGLEVDVHLVESGKAPLTVSFSDTIVQQSRYEVVVTPKRGVQA